MDKRTDARIYCPFSFSTTADLIECLKGNCALWDGIEGPRSINEAGFYSSEIVAALDRVAAALGN